MKAYRSEWRSDDTRSEWLIVNAHHIFKRTKYRYPSTAEGLSGYIYQWGDWQRETDIKASELEEMRERKELKKGGARLSFY